jgi:thiol:disulfide interchange protein DsbD
VKPARSRFFSHDARWAVASGLAAMPAMLAAALLALAGIAPPAAAAPVRTDLVEAELVAERGAPEPGKPLTLALRLRPAKGWHTYWRNPGDSGQPTSIEWQLPPGYRAGPIQWPVPEKLPIGPLANYGYENEVLLLTDLEVPARATSPARFAARAKWLVCNPERCIPESAELSLALAGPAAPTPWAQAIAYARDSLPEAAGAAWRLEAKGVAGGVRLEVAPPAGFSAKTLQFFPYEEGKVRHAAAQALERRDAGLRLLIPAVEQPLGGFERLRGVLVADGVRGFEIDVPVIGAILSAPSGAPAATLGFAAALALAFAGGLILNLMPCVLPVLSIKVLGFARGKSAPQMRAHGLIYGAGVLASFLALAGLLIALKAAGSAVGWGFQLQSPVFVGLLAALFLALALNLSGAFEFASLVPARLAGAGAKHPHADAFLTGVLAVLVASPCTVPFMGAALGYALTESAAVALAVFAALGTGMATPYVLLAFEPRWLRRLPKPGPWMVTLKRWLALPLYATVAWLAWVLSIQVGAVAAQPKADLWQPYSEARVAELVAQGKPVFVDFTAAWCVTCQVNKQLVLARPETERAFAERGVQLLRADWTREDPAITRALAALGRNGVPVYVLYRPGRAPRLLPEILTREALDAALAELKT